MPTSTYKQYLTTYGDRFDWLAWIGYRNPYGYTSIMERSKQNFLTSEGVYQFPVLLPPALTLQIPAQQESSTISPNLLPPWKR